MTTAIITTNRQQLRKRWVRGMACLGLMLVACVASGIAGLASPRFLGTYIEVGRWAIVRTLHNISSDRRVGLPFAHSINRLADYLSPLIIDTRSYDEEDAECEDAASSEPQLKLEVSETSRLDGSLSLPEDSNWLPPSVLLTPEEFAEMTPEDHDEESRPCFPVRHFPTCADRSEPFVFISYITITR